MLNNKKIIIFGAGNGGINFIKHNPNLTILAIADNNPSNWNTQLNGFPIINPATITDYDFNQVVITSQWQDAIQSQLINQLNIPKEKIHIPAKSALKPGDAPFKHPVTLAFARTSLGKVSEFLAAQQITAILDSGTALGVVRDGDLIAWDDDIDLAIDSKDFDKMLEVASQLLKELPQHPAAKWQATVITLAGEDAALNLDLITSQPEAIKDIEISLQKRHEQQGRSEIVSTAGIFDAPAIHFQNPQKTNFFGYQVYLPNQVEDFLTFMYGDWKNPKPQTSLQDYDNRYKQQQADPRSQQITKRQLV